VNRDPIGEEGGRNVHSAFLDDPINRYDSLGQTVAFTQNPTDFSGNRSAPTWPTVPPTGVRAAGYAQHTSGTYTYDEVQFLFWCKLENLQTSGKGWIVIGSDVSPSAPTPGNPSRRVLQHEQEHINIFKTSLTDFDSYASQLMKKWKCCSCTSAMEAYMGTLWTYYRRVHDEEDAQLNCSDYSGAEKTHACNVVLPAATASRTSAYTAMQTAIDTMKDKCGF
jgi:hypothetical protein